VSDLHLHADLPHTTAAFTNYLAQTTADAVLILGDLFEAWVGDDMRHEPYEAMCTQALATYGEKAWLGIMVGNRDFLLSDDMLSSCKAHRLADPTLLEAFGQRMLLAHGDALCLDDLAYLQFRQQVRQPAWQAAFLSKPLPERLAIARQMRAASAEHQTQQNPQAWADVDAETARQWLHAAASSTMIHGHTHRPGQVTLGPDGALQRVVLADWDMDHASPPRGEILRLTATGLTRIPLPVS